jgi:predicted methyltransferase MtxX (methanogen marker protein 4)
VQDSCLKYVHEECCRSKGVYDLHHWPPTREINLVDTKPLLAVCIANTGINIVVVQHRSEAGIIVDTLTTGTIDKAVRLQNSSASTLSALLARLVDKPTSCAGRSAYLDLVLLALGGSVGIETAALANREEKVVVFAVQSNERRFLSVLALGLEGDGCVLGAAYGLDWGVLHVDGEQVAPEGAVGHDELGSVPV